MAKPSLENLFSDVSDKAAQDGFIYGATRAHHNRVIVAREFENKALTPTPE